MGPTGVPTGSAGPWPLRSGREIGFVSLWPCPPVPLGGRDGQIGFVLHNCSDRQWHLRPWPPASLTARPGENWLCLCARVWPPVEQAGRRVRLANWLRFAQRAWNWNDGIVECWGISARRKLGSFCTFRPPRPRGGRPNWVRFTQSAAPPEVCPQSAIERLALFRTIDPLAPLTSNIRLHTSNFSSSYYTRPSITRRVA